MKQTTQCAWRGLTAAGAAGALAALAGGGAPPVVDAPADAASAAPPAAAASAPAAPAPAHSESHGYAIHWQRPLARAADDGVVVVPQGWSGVLLRVTSSAGSGQAEVRPRRGGWPNRVALEFRQAPDRPFDTLEGLRLQVVNPAHRAGDEVPPLVPDDFSFWQREGRFWIELPPGWLQGQQGLRLQWVDRYRR